jgi:transcriptional regulator with XRE-family HTH domain
VTEVAGGPHLAGGNLAALNGDLATALAILRIVCSWSQQELADASGLRAGTISDYERGKMVPGLVAVGKLLSAEGFTWAELQKAQEFVQTLRLEKLGGSLAAEPADRNWEIEKVAAAAGTVLSQIVRLMLRGSPGSSESPAKGGRES